MTQAAALTDAFRDAYELVAGRPEESWLRALREAAFSHYAAKGLPTSRDEGWRHTSVKGIAATAFSAPSSFETSQASLLSGALVDLGGPRAVFVNGRFAPSLSSLAPAHGVSSLADVLKREPQILAECLGREARSQTPFTALNTALFEDGALVAVPPGRESAEPIHVVFYSDADRPTMTHARVLVSAGARSAAVVVESHLGRGAYLTNAVTELQLAEGAHLTHVKLQQESESAFHVATLAAALGRDARLIQHHVSLGGWWARADILARFDGEGGECVLNGLFHADGERSTDTHTLLDHRAPRATSRELYKGILDGRARGVFHGLIQVRRDAQKTSAHQSNKNLLLSKDALVQSTPQLEILADDVKCKHGSTTGQLEESALFYLRSRGIGASDARALLTYAFASELIQQLPHPALREGVAAYLHSRLGDAEEIRAAAL